MADLTASGPPKDKTAGGRHGGAGTIVSRRSLVTRSVVGAIVGAVPASLLVIGVTEVLKAMLAVVSRQPNWAIIAIPLAGIALSLLLLYGLGVYESKGGLQRPARRWRAFPHGMARSDLTAAVVHYAGEEEQFPWRLGPLRALAIAATVGLGAPMGTESPAAYLGMVAGVAIGDHGHEWRRFLRPAAIGGGAAGVSVLMGIPLIGTLYILELGRRNDAPLTPERLIAGLVGGLVGWALNVALGVDLVRLVVPKEAPHSLGQAVITACLIGVLAGSISSMTGEAIYRAKAWRAHPAIRFASGALVLGATTVLLSRVAAPSAAVGPGGGAIRWVESSAPFATTILAVAVLRAVATASAAAAGGCGGLFVPFLAVGDLAGRVFASALGVPGDLAGSAGAACGIAGGYRLPFTAVALVLGQGGPDRATLTCLGAVGFAGVAAMGTEWVLDRALGQGFAAVERRTGPPAGGPSGTGKPPESDPTGGNSSAC